MEKHEIKKGTLYMIPTPIGETAPEIILPPSTLDILHRLDYFVVENLRTARRFLSAAGIGKPIDSLNFAELNEHTRNEDVARLVEPMLAGHDCGMISEAGVPGVADPGAELAAACHRNGIGVVPLVGPSSLLLALMASGLNGQSFSFNGYLPVKEHERKQSIRNFERRAVSERQSQIFIETPYRNMKLLDDMLAVCRPETMLTLAVDITSPQEYIRTLSISQWRKTIKPELHKRPAIFIIL